MPVPQPHRVAVLALDRVVPFDLGIPARVFGSARGADGEPLYEVLTCSIGGRPVATAADYAISVAHDESILRQADTVVVSTQEPEGPLRERGELDPEVGAALALIRPGTRIVSTCTGSFVLAAAGLLDGLEATTHWAWAERFEALFPRVTMRADELFVDNGRVITGAGAASGLDLCLHLIRRDHGTAVANAAARVCVVPPHRDGGQAQFIALPVPEAPDTSTATTREWALTRLDQALSLEQLAAHAHMSVRTFTRRFRAEVGLSPTEWLNRQRVERAREMLEASDDLSVEAVAQAAGFPSATVLRRHMREVLGTVPTAYRRTFRAAA